MAFSVDIGCIQRWAEQKWDENWRFRSFLKMTDMSTEEVDAVVHRLYKEVSEQIDCTKCANCCRSVSPELSPHDMARLGRHLSISEEELLAEHLMPGEQKDRWRFAETPCPFLCGDLCTVYEARPENCRSYPHLHKDEFVLRLMGVISNCSVCPIVYHVYERLKGELWH